MTIWVNLLKQRLKDYKLLFLMGLFPILLTGIFVTMFTTIQEVDEEISFSMYIDKAEEGNLSESVTNYLNTVIEELDITLEASKEKNVDFIVKVDERVKSLSIENLGGNSVEETMLYALLNEFCTQYGLMQVADGQLMKPMPLETQILEGNGKKDITTPIVVTMLVFGILLGGNYGIKQIIYMREAVGIRALTAPITRYKLYLMEFSVSTVVICAISMIVAFSYECLFGVKFSQNILLSFTLILLISMLATLLGMTIGVNVKDEDTGGNILSMIITFTCILSGGLMPTFELGSIISFSPITHLAQALNDIVMTGQIMHIGNLVVTLSVCTILLGIISMIGLRRREQ